MKKQKTKVLLLLAITTASILGLLWWHHEQELKRIAQTPVFKVQGKLERAGYFMNPIVLNNGEFLLIDTVGAVQIYDPALGTSQIVNEFGKDQDYLVASITQLDNNRVLVTGASRNQAQFFSKIYDVTQNRYRDTAPMNATRAGYSATRLQDGRVLIAGGQFQGKPVLALETFDPKFEKYELLPGKLIAGGGKAVRLSNNQVLFLGDVMQIYNPATGKVKHLGSWWEARNGFAYQALKDNRILILYTKYPNTATIYNPPTNTFMGLVEKPHNARYWYPATSVLPDGKVLIAGGYGCTYVGERCSYGSRVVEIFDPKKHTFSLIGRTDKFYMHGAILQVDQKTYLIDDSIGFVEVYQ